MHRVSTLNTPSVFLSKSLENVRFQGFFDKNTDGVFKKYSKHIHEQKPFPRTDAYLHIVVLAFVVSLF